MALALTKDITDEIKHDAKIPHEWFMGNIGLLHIVLPIGLLKFGDATIALALPMALSMVWIGLTYLKTQKAWKAQNWYVAANWQVSFNRYKILMIAYAVTWIIIGLGMLIASTSSGSMQGIMETVFTRIAAIPTFIIVVVMFVLESGAMFDVTKGGISEKIIEKFPPPADMVFEKEKH